MNLKCPKQCLLEGERYWKTGTFIRKSDSKTLIRWRCPKCKSTFSGATGSPCFGQKKRRINSILNNLLSSGISLRRAAILLKVNRKTVVRKLCFLGEMARKEQCAFIQSLQTRTIFAVQFDDLETTEHTKCKPLSVSLAVEAKSRKILAYEVSVMPAKGPLAKISKAKYGFRPDHRSAGLGRIFEILTSCVAKEAEFLSDQNPLYPSVLKKYFPKATHKTVKGQRGCVSGQGELKRICHDPLFSLNHTCAMLRANINRLFRRTWCTTKKIERLLDHLAIYVNYHNQVLT